jgi:hypothetical protein
LLKDASRLLRGPHAGAHAAAASRCACPSLSVCLGSLPAALPPDRCAASPLRVGAVAPSASARLRPPPSAPSASVRRWCLRRCAPTCPRRARSTWPPTSRASSCRPTSAPRCIARWAIAPTRADSRRPTSTATSRTHSTSS